MMTAWVVKVTAPDWCRDLQYPPITGSGSASPIFNIWTHIEHSKFWEDFLNVESLAESQLQVLKLCARQWAI